LKNLYFQFADAADHRGRRHFVGAAAAGKNTRRAAADSLSKTGADY